MPSFSLACFPFGNIGLQFVCVHVLTDFHEHHAIRGYLTFILSDFLPSVLPKWHMYKLLGWEANAN
jgi:hypothetical protein